MTPFEIREIEKTIGNLKTEIACARQELQFSGLKDKVTQHPELNVFNGIAYHPGRKTFFVTGKNWDNLFEVKILPKE